MPSHRSPSPLTRSTGVCSHEMRTSSGGTRQVSPYGQMSASTMASLAQAPCTSAQSYENVAGPRTVRSPLLSSRHSPETYEVPQVRESVRVTGQAAHDHHHPHSQTLSTEASSSTSVRRAYENTTLKPVHSAREVSVRSKSPHKYSAFPWSHDTEELQVENTSLLTTLRVSKSTYRQGHTINSCPRRRFLRPLSISKCFSAAIPELICREAPLALPTKLPLALPPLVPNRGLMQKWNNLSIPSTRELQLQVKLEMKSFRRQWRL